MDTKHCFGPWSNAAQKLHEIHEGRPRGGSPAAPDGGSSDDECVVSPILHTSPYLNNATFRPPELSCKDKRRILRRKFPDIKRAATAFGQTARVLGFDGVLWAGNALIEIRGTSWSIKETTGPCTVEVISSDPATGAVATHMARFRHPTIHVTGHSGSHAAFVTATKPKGCFFLSHNPALEYTGDHPPQAGLALAELWKPETQVIYAQVPGTDTPAYVLGGVAPDCVFCQTCRKKFYGDARTVQLAEHIGLNGRLSKIQFRELERPNTGTQ